MIRSLREIVIRSLNYSAIALVLALGFFPQDAVAQGSGVFFEKFGGASYTLPDGTPAECTTGSSLTELIDCLLDYQKNAICNSGVYGDLVIPNTEFVSRGPDYGLVAGFHEWQFRTACEAGPGSFFPLEPGVPRDWWVDLPADGNECPAGQQLATVIGECVTNSGYQLVPPPSEPCSKTDRINPCDVSNGNKLETEPDYAPGANGSVRFSRYYNSIGPYRSGENFAHGWRHTYSRAMDERPDKYFTPAFAVSVNESVSYTTELEACEAGWPSIKDGAWGGDLSTAIATYSGGNVCEISAGGSTKAYFLVRSVDSRPVFTGPPTIHTISRPNGSVIHFKQFGTDWISELNPAYTLEAVGINWIFTDLQDTRETYDSDGKLIQIEYRNGQTETLTYDRSVAEGGDDNPATLDRVAGQFGHGIGFQYDANGRLETVITLDGSIQYGYDGNDNLISVTYPVFPNPTVRQFLYEDPTLPNHLTGRIDENGDRVSTYAYDGAGRAILSERAGSNERVQLAYNPDGSTTLSLGNGAIRTYVFTTEQGERKPTMILGDVCATCPNGNIADRIYDGNGFLDEVLDWNGNTTQTIRNSVGLTETLIEGKGSTEQRTTTTTWHPTLRIPTQIVSPKNTTDFTHDSKGNILTMTVSSGVLSRTWTMTYDTNGQPLTIDGPRTDVTDITTLEYYNCTTASSCGQIHTMTNALGQITTYNGYDGAGRPTHVTDANGLQTFLAYDARGNVLQVFQFPAVGTPRATTMTYDQFGQLKTLSAPDGMVLTYSYSAAHYLTSVTDNFGNHIDYDYDVMGNLADQDTYDPGNVLKRALDYAYDLNNRLDTVTNGGHLTDLSIDLVGNLTNEFDPKMANTQHVYDALNRLDQTIDALTGLIDYDYDDHDNITSVTSANGAQTNYVFDGLDNLTQEVSPDRGTIIYSYDEAGDRKTELDARGKLTTYSYDALNRLTLVSLNDGGTIAYEYDVGTNAIGRLNKITDATGQTTWSYDNFGAITQKVQTIGGVSLTTSYTYDGSGKLATMTLPSGKVVTFGYNIFQQNSVSVDGQAILSGATYDPFGSVNSWTWGNGSATSRNFDLRGLPTSIGFAGDTQTLGYDNAGQVTSQLDSILDVTYDYDLLGRLTDFNNNKGGGGPGSPSGPMFTGTPVILADIQTAANETGNPATTNPTPWVMTGVRNVGSGSVQLALERAEVDTGSIAVAETIGYIAIEGGASGSFAANANTINYEAQITADHIKGWGNGCYTTNFVSGFSSTPTAVASINRHDSGEGGWIRRCSLSNTSIGLTVDEDQFRDSERKHNQTEGAGIAAFSQDFDARFNDGVKNWGMEAATVVLAATTSDPSFKQVAFRQSYTTPPIVVVLATNETSDPAAIRIRNVTTTSFEAVQVEPASADGTQGAMTLHYLAVEPGTHELPDGTRILADSVSTTSQQHGTGVSGAESWATATFADWPGTSPGGPLPISQTMTYDANSNRFSLTEDGSPYNYTNLLTSNRLLSTTGPTAKTYTYDLAGNIIGDGIHTYAYDDRGRLVSVDFGSTTYQHNGQGQRVKKDTGTATLFVYDEDGSLIGEYDSMGTAIQETVWFNGAPIAVLQGANLHYVHTDQLGTPRAITDGNTIIWRWHSDPFGSTAADEDPDGNSTLFTYNPRFPGQYYDDETGLHYNYFRTYDPSTGRYLESDPIGLGGGLNTYGYVGGNPTGYFDRFGLDRSLIIVGDPGLGVHDVGRNFERVAQTLKNQIESDECECNSADVVKASNVEAFNNAITNGPTIDGDVFFVGHGTSSALYIGETSARGSNLDVFAALGLSRDNKLGRDAGLVLLSCNAGSQDGDSVNIAQAIADRFKRNVTAYPGDLLFSPNPNSSGNGASPGAQPPPTGPLHMVPATDGTTPTIFEPRP